MQRTDTLIIGAGQAGLALSRCLTDAGRDHVALDRGRLAERWRTERWDSLRLLTPNWMTRLPGWHYRGTDLGGFMTAPELVASFEDYAASFAAPVQEHTIVEGVWPTDDGYRIETNQGAWSANNVVVATGAEGHVQIPPPARALSSAMQQLPSNKYRNPDQLARGGVLVVGASATGIQLADELAQSGRDVVLSVGDHTRVPRRYRGRDIYWWLDRSGVFDATIDQMPDAAAARHAPSLQLVGRPTHEELDLGVLQHRGIALAGMLEQIDGHRVQFGDDLAAMVHASERRMHHTLDEIDRFIDVAGLSSAAGGPDRPAPVRVATTPRQLDLRGAGIETVLWATGFGRSYPWLHVPVLGIDGEIRHWRGVTDAPGLYVLGLRFQYYRNSNFIDGVGRDARYIANCIVDHTSARVGHPEEVAA